MSLDLEWDRKLWQRRGAPKRLLGITVFHDFRWRTQFGDNRTQFRHGMALAARVKADCPAELTPRCC